MSITKSINSKSNIKQYSNADLPSQFRTPVIAKYGPVDSTANQSVINLGFSVDTILAPEVFFLSVDGKLLSQGSGNDFTFTSVDSFGMSSQVTLNSGLPAGLNIQAWKLGLKKETEMLQDSRFNQTYEAMDNGFQAFIQQPLMNPTTATGTPASGSFHSTVVNRKPILNMAQDLGVRLGVERIPTQTLFRIQDEFGPSGENVFGVPNDSLNRIRFLGNASAEIALNSNAITSATATADTSFLEVTFYGTGLNLLDSQYTGAGYESYTVTVDGVAAPSIANGVASGVLNGRGYAQNRIRPIVSGLGLGVHTIRIGFGRFLIHGIEILNETLNLRVNSGAGFVAGKKATLLSQAPFAFNAAATGTRGGRVVTFLNQNGTVGQAFRPVDSAQLNLAAADHSNEEIIRNYSFREFGANRADDFSTLVAANSDRSFTLDDGTTTLTGNQIAALSGNALAIDSVIGNGITFTFVGTGLDLDVATNTHTAGYDVFIDGISLVLNSTTVFRRTTDGIVKVVSGLPYGTHTLRIRVASAATNFSFRSFIVYQPKKPIVPAGVVELADYIVMANFAANSVAGPLRISTGVLRKVAIREMTYVNGTGGSTDWTVNNGFTVYTAGQNLETNRLNAYVEYTFFGTGFDFRFISASNRANNITVSLQSLSTGGSLVPATIANFPTMVNTVYGTGVTFVNTNGFLDQQDPAQSDGAGFTLSGLPLGEYKVRFNNNVGGSILDFDSLDIITPIHSVKLNESFGLQNTINVGSQSISDSRKLTPVKDLGAQIKNISQAVGVQSGPTTNITTNLIPLPDMSLTHDCTTGKVKVTFQITARNNTSSAATLVAVFANGIQSSVEKSGGDTVTANFNLSLTDVIVLNVPVGVNKFDLYWRVNAGTSTAGGIARIMVVEDV